MYSFIWSLFVFLIVGFQPTAKVFRIRRKYHDSGRGIFRLSQRLSQLKEYTLTGTDLAAGTLLRSA